MANTWSLALIYKNLHSVAASFTQSMVCNRKTLNILKKKKKKRPMKKCWYLDVFKMNDTIALQREFLK